MLRKYRNASAWAVLAAALAYALYALYDVAGYRNAVVHPHYFMNNMPALVPEYLSLGWHELINIFYPFAAWVEYRPRFLTYFFLLLDHHLRFFLYNYVIFPPTFSISWILQLIVGPYYFYRLMLILTRDRQAAWLTLAVYLSSVGFLSGFSIAFAPGKPLSHVVFILVLYLGAVLDRRVAPDWLLFAIPGIEKYVLAALLFFGAFLDEMPFFAFPLLVLMFPNRFRPPLRTTRLWGSAALNLGALALPFAAFLFFTIVVAPLVTESHFNYRFDYISTLLNENLGADKTAPTEGPLGKFSLQMIGLNLLALWGSAVVPLRVDRLENLFSAGPDYDARVMLYGVCVSLLALGFLVAYLAGGSKSRRMLVARTAVAMLAFVLFFSLVEGRHGGWAYGFYYGSMFAVFIAMMFGACFAALTPDRPALRWAFLALSVFVVGMQVHNLRMAQRSFANIHNAISAQYLRDLKLTVDDAHPVDRAALNELLTAWREGRLEARLREQPVPVGAAYLVAELRHIEYLRALHKENR